ncbi:ABC transporter ATP-binding protein [Nocardia neocaledoniensis]|uniref:ABC transporter ATP-binding protein n=1 Tax=Nocardia neocaledoniensis TaxID=236511 RepID=UPI00245545E1|nr:ABC transporter ATP-binding protein [Nocardia neocaledoniensis]
MLEATNLKVRYRNGALGVLDITARVAPGQVVALFGPNGAGKTTAVRAVTGFLGTEGARVIAGKVTLDGRDITNVEPSRICRMGVSLVPERQKIFPAMSVRENLNALGRRPARSHRKQVQERVFALFPMLAERLGEPAGQLSGGQQQMLAIARTLMTEPRVLIVDEMTQGLHHSMQPVLFDAIRDIAASGTSVVLVDESTGFALQVADYCYLIGGGAVRDHGPAARFEDNALLTTGYVAGEELDG